MNGTVLSSNADEIPIDLAAMLLEIMTEEGNSVMLWGVPGLGKTAIINQLGAKKGRKVIVLKTNVREPVDLRGVPVGDLATGTTKWLVPSELPQVERDGERGYLFLDEINTGTTQMMAVVMGLAEERKVGDYVLPDGWVVIAAGNRVSDRAAAQRMPTALRNRFAHLYIRPDVKAWAKWANSNGVAQEVVAFVRLRPELIHVMPRGDENAFPTPRSLTKAAKYVNAHRSVRQKLFAAHIGSAVASELDGFIDLYASIGSLADIVKDPDKAPLPADASIRYATVTGLGRLADRKNFANIIRYAERLPRESQVLVVHDATIRVPTLKNTSEYGAWAVKNQDIVLQKLSIKRRPSGRRFRVRGMAVRPAPFSAP
jgi:MoxR-like ATPase